MERTLELLRPVSLVAANAAGLCPKANLPASSMLYVRCRLAPGARSAPPSGRSAMGLLQRSWAARPAHPHEHAVVDLPQPQQLQDLSRLRVHVVDSADADCKHDLALWLDIETVLRLCLAL